MWALSLQFFLQSCKNCSLAGQVLDVPVCCVLLLDALLLGPPDLPLAAILLALVLGETSPWQNLILWLLSDARLLHNPLPIV